MQNYLLDLITSFWMTFLPERRQIVQGQCADQLRVREEIVADQFNCDGSGRARWARPRSPEPLQQGPAAHSSLSGAEGIQLEQWLWVRAAQGSFWILLDPFRSLVVNAACTQLYPKGSGLSAGVTQGDPSACSSRSFLLWNCCLTGSWELKACSWACSHHPQRQGGGFWICFLMSDNETQDWGTGCRSHNPTLDEYLGAALCRSVCYNRTRYVIQNILSICYIFNIIYFSYTCEAKQIWVGEEQFCWSRWLSILWNWW